MNQRVRHIDIARGVAITTMIAVHTGFIPFQDQLLPLLTPWMFAVFAFVHGRLRARALHKPSGVDYAWQRARTLLGMYVTVGLGSYLVWLALRWYAQGSVLFASWQDGLMQLVRGIQTIYNGPLWFLPMFFLACIMFDQWLRIPRIRIRYMPLWAVGALFLSYLDNPAGQQFMYSPDISLQYVGYMIIGYAHERSRIRLTAVQLAAVAGAFAISSWSNGTIDVFARMYGVHVAYWTSAILGSVVVVGYARRMDHYVPQVSRVFARLGRASFILLVTHWPIMQYLTFVLDRVGVLGRLDAVPTYTSFSSSLSIGMNISFLLLYVALPLSIVRLFQISRSNG